MKSLRALNGLRWPLLQPEDRVLVAVSGGPDSLSLLHALHTHSGELGLATLEAAHLDHELRGEQSAAEAQWVAAWCADRCIPCHLGKINVGELSHKRKVSMQQAAREARYAFLDATAAAIGADKIATGHTQDDQVETVLLHILRGTGLDGLKGIPARRGLYVRPLLAVSRAEIEDYCSANHLSPRRDPSNLFSDHYTRNKIRLELLPQLARDYNPAVGDALLRLSEIAARDMDYLQNQAELLLPQVTLARQEDGLVLDARKLAALHPAMQRHILRIAFASLRGTREGLAHSFIEAICTAIVITPRSPFGLTTPNPHCIIRVTKRRITFRRLSAGKSRDNRE